MAAIVEVRDLYKSFTRGEEKIDVLMDLNLDVEEGEFLALMGPSGSGKTTLLNLIAGLDSPTEGTIRVGDQLISAKSESELARWRTRNVGFVFQFYNLLPVLTAYENVELPLLLLQLSKSQRQKQVENALNLVGLGDRMTHRPGQLSGGQCQRVGIARAIVTDPTIVVCDEPTGALDAKSANDALSLLELLRSELGKTILMVTHDPHAAERAQRIVQLEKGRLVGGNPIPTLARANSPILPPLPRLCGGEGRGEGVESAPDRESILPCEEGMPPHPNPLPRKAGGEGIGITTHAECGMFPNPEQFGQSAPVETSLLELAVYSTLMLLGLIFFLTVLAVVTLPLFFGAMYAMELVVRGFQNMPDPVGKYAKLAGLVFRSLRRNLLRTALTYVALFVLTGMLTMLYGVVNTIGKLTQDQEDSQLVIMSEKFGIPSMMKPGYAPNLKSIIRDKLPKDMQPADIDKNFMTWSFVGATLDLNKMTPENSMFLFSLDPDAVTNGMMKEQGLNPDDLGEDNWEAMKAVIALVKEDKRNIIVGADRLEKIGKKVGDEIKLFGTNYKDIEFECKIVGAFPAGSRMAMNAAMRYDYLLAKLDDYRARTGKDHPVADRCLNLVWVRMPSKAAYQQLAAVVNDPASFSNPATKMETFSAAIGSFIEPFKDIFWGLKFIIMPAIVVIMCLVIGITITIGVRERWTEMAVMKVLGFQPWQIVSMIVSEAMLIGVYGGLLSTWAVYFLPMGIRSITKAIGVKVAFFDTFNAPMMIVVYGPLLGLLVGLIGAALPAWNARKVKVSQVFAQVA